MTENDCPGSGQFQADRPAYAHRTAGNQNHFVFKIHDYSL
jgi:hypothetical protein